MSIQTQYVDGQYQLKNPTFHVEDSPWKAAQVMRMISKHNLQPHHIAEVGCGAGEILVQLSQQVTGASYFGYELSPQGYELCKSRTQNNITYFNTDLFENPGTTYDLVLSMDVFEHVEDYFTFLRRLATCGKAFIFHIPLDMNVQMVFRSNPILHVRDVVGHLHYFSKDTALATLHDCGYRVVDWFYTPNGADRPRSTKAKILKLPRKILFGLHQDLAARILGGYSLLVYALPDTNGAAAQASR